MNKSEIVGRVAGRMGLSKPAAEGAVDTALAALCAVPDDTLPTAHWNPAAWMFAGRILGPLRWFGLVEWREPQEIFEARCWRKTALFDRFVSFDVRLTDARPAGH